MIISRRKTLVKQNQGKKIKNSDFFPSFFNNVFIDLLNLRLNSSFFKRNG